MSDIGTDPLIPKNGGTGVTNNNAATINLGSPVSGYALICNSVGACTLQPVSASGAVTSVSVVSANGFAGTVTATTTPAITLTTSQTGVLSGNGTAISGSAITQHATLVAGASNAITSVGPSSTTGAVYVGGGATADPSFNTDFTAITNQVTFNHSNSGGVTAFELNNASTSSASSTQLLITSASSTGISDAFIECSLAGGGSSNAYAFGYQTSTGHFVLATDHSDAASSINGTPILSGISGGGIAFNQLTGLVYANAGSAATVVAYAQGTFTPAVTFGGGNTGITYNAQTGTYTRIGNMVYVYIFIQLTSKGSSTGGMNITGLPFTVNASINPPAPIVSANLTPTVGTSYWNVQFLAGSTTAAIPQMPATGSAGTSMSDTNFANNTYFYTAGSYQI